MRNTQLDGLRGWAALSVAIYHGINIPSEAAHNALMLPIQAQTSAYAIATKLLVATFNGSLAVVIFFVLSGKVLLESLMRSRKSMPESSLDFTIRRIIRIYPPLWVALAAYVLMFFIMRRFSDWTAVPDLHLVLVNATLTKITMYGVAWTLVVELLAAPLIVIAAWFYKKHGGQALFVLLALLLLFKDSPILSFLPYFSTYAFLFALGFLTCTNFGKQLAKDMPGVSPSIVMLLMIYGVLFTQYDLPNVVVFQGITAFLLVAIISEDNDTWPKRFFNLPVSQFLGRISFSLYLLHPLALEMLEHWADHLTGNSFREHYLASGIVIGILTPVLTIPIASLMYKYVETTSIELGKVFSEKICGIVFGNGVKAPNSLQ
ncbi:acyltransferase family protein [Burkholderia multivorans]|uniref:acyltransferase family protein n=1 Tax=Burkholderia multivorans TaxID=87883 RepID=UPI0009B92D90|nr:acyltransferase [Burkholderia multivorans]MBR8107434.1 acyltransferase [Burkholderia multivorans]MBR8340371.1 acyltransferase [Burkholderia multivorans]MBU9463646.1 acyltransferase [Burkholderia multivorans]MBU9568818.1 acyltransferase [Burkholderia multivorans]MBU9590093.1 acyltransferase [Burkholderia multivorans]